MVAKVSALTDKLRALYQRAILRPHEEGDEARLNEARASAFLLLKIARDNGVQVKFVVGEEASKAGAYARYERPKPSPASRPRRGPPAPSSGGEACFCGKPVSTRIAFNEFYCTHVEHH
jgi:hypothetical protein